MEIPLQILKQVYDNKKQYTSYILVIWKKIWNFLLSSIRGLEMVRLVIWIW